MQDIVLNILSFLLSSAALFISAIIGAALTIAYYHFYKSRKIQGFCLLLYYEVERHCIEITQLKKPLTECQNALIYLTAFPDKEWNNVKYFLAETLPKKEFEQINKHYRFMYALKDELDHIKDPMLEISMQTAHWITAKETEILLKKLSKGVYKSLF